MIRKNAQWDGDLLAQRVSKNCTYIDKMKMFMEKYQCDENNNVVFMTHNTAFLKNESELVSIGGQNNRRVALSACKNKTTSKVNVGLWMSRMNTNSTWHNFKHIVSNQRCKDMRNSGYLASDHRCEFDGRLSIVKYNNTYFLYGRHNPMPSRGRHVLVSKTHDLNKWNNFELVHVSDVRRHVDNEIYTFYAFNDLVKPRLLSLYPLIRRGKATISLSCSTDGVRWNSPLVLFNTSIVNGRVKDHPVHGTWFEHPFLYVMIQKNVPGVVPMKSNTKYSIDQYKIRYQFIDNHCNFHTKVDNNNADDAYDFSKSTFREALPRSIPLSKNRTQTFRFRKILTMS